MESLLNLQADQIERVLASHGIPALVYGGRVGPRLVEFHLSLASGIRLSRLEGLTDELALALGVSQCRVERRDGMIAIQVPRPQGRTVHLLGLMQKLGKIPPCTAVMGVDPQGIPILLRLSSPDIAHLLIAGTTGSGKTEMAKAMITSLAVANRPHDLRLLLIDPKSRGYTAFRELPHLLGPVISDPRDAEQRLADVVQEMERRDRAGESSPRILIFVDEMADLFLGGGPGVGHLVARLVQRGREAGIHLVACTQKPTAALLGTLVKSNFPARLVGSVASAEDARTAAGIGGTGAEHLTGRGDFLLIVKGTIRRIQGAYISPQEIQTTVHGLVHSQRSSVAPDAGTGGGMTKQSAPLGFHLRLIK
jgi:S-DNA-T family DNA segregation ATPase FtsK/SpoIIIE